MGVKGLYKLIKEHAPAAISPVHLRDYYGKTVAIDTSIAVFQWCSVGRSRNIVNAEGKYINHIQGAFFRTVALLTAGITPVFVFDGKSPDAKQQVIDVRRSLREKYNNGLPIGVFGEVRKLLNIMGVTCIIADGEAEALAAFMARDDIVDAVATEDLDALAFGSPIMLRGFNTNKAFSIDLNIILRDMEITYDQFVDLCILLGTDYTGTIPGIGPKRAVKLIKKHKCIENIIKTLDKQPVDFEYQKARDEFFQDNSKKVNIGSPNFTPDGINELRDFLVTTHGLSEKRVNGSLSKLKKM